MNSGEIQRLTYNCGSHAGSAPKMTNLLEKKSMPLVVRSLDGTDSMRPLAGAALVTGGGR